MDLVVGWIERRFLIRLVEVNAKVAQVGEVAFPQHSAGIDITCTEAVYSLDEQSPTHNLFRRSVPVRGSTSRLLLPPNHSSPKGSFTNSSFDFRLFAISPY